MIERRTLLTLAGTAAVAALTGTVRAQNTSADAPVATTAYGKVRGAMSNGINVFKGVPYGASTAGANRFHAPKPPQPWTAVRDALKYPPRSPQTINSLPGVYASWSFGQEISEDCLALNVWTPALRDGVKRPVMVWFHGGDYGSLSGSADIYDGTRLSKKGDVVVVTLNHRLNAFGFLYLAELAPEFADGANADGVAASSGCSAAARAASPASAAAFAAASAAASAAAAAALAASSAA